MGARSRRFLTRTAVILAAVVIATVFLGAASAQAAVISSRNWRVQPTGTVGTGVPVVVNGSGSFDGSPLDLSTLVLKVDDVVVPRSAYIASTPFTRNLYLYHVPRPALADGAHTFSVEIADTLGRVSARQWDATVAQAPEVAWIAPDAGSVIYDGLPAIELGLADNTPGTLMNVEGQVRSGSPTGPLAGEFGASDLPAGRHSFSLSAELPPGEYFLTATVRDAAGNARILGGTTARAFSVVDAPAMSVFAADCLECHVTTGHPATTRACEDCHTYVYHEYAQCQDCHYGHDGPVTVTGVFGPCDVCHDADEPATPRHTAASVDPAHASSCDGCHEGSLVAQHAVEPAGSQYAYQCDVCHLTDDARVVAAVAAGDTACSACHDADHIPLHDVTVSESCAREGCHTGTNLTTIHSGTCGSCHDSTDAVVLAAITGGLKDCEACHPSADHESLHVVDVDPDCAGCHAGTSLTMMHPGCDGCHTSTDETVSDAIDNGQRQCLACHTVQPHPDLGSTHTPTVSSGALRLFDNHEGMGAIWWDLPCDLCHGSLDLLTVHANDCAACHNGAKPAASFATWAGGCQQGACHVGLDHPTGQAAHDRLNCESCHEPSWAVYYESCDWCHNPSSAAPVTSSDVKATYVGTAAIRMSTPGIAYTSYRIDGGPRIGGTIAVVQGPAVGSESHTIEYWSTDDSGREELPHKTAGFVISADTVPPTTTSNAQAAYAGAVTISLTPSDNNSTPVSQTYWRLNGGAVRSGRTVSIPEPASGTVAYTLEFWSVDPSGNEELPHKTASFTVMKDTVAPVTSTDAPAYDKTAATLIVRFTATDPAPGSGVAATYRRINGGSAFASNVYYVYSQGVYNIQYWSVDRSGNVEVAKTHVLVKDWTPPVTTANALATYTGEAVIDLSATDALAGVANTYYILDGEPQQAGTRITVTADGTHTLKFWSVDRAGNVESQKSVTFTLTGGTPDTTPPVTTSNALASYSGNAVITLTATDGGGSGVQATYYTVDGGGQTAGTVITIPQPVEGSEEHTVSFWSVDHAGNSETPTVVTFTVSRISGTGTIRLVWGDSDSSGAGPVSGSWAAWTIRSGGPSGAVVASGSQTTGSGWDGVDDITVAAQAEPYHVSIDWYDADWDYEDITVHYPVYVGSGATVVLRY